MKDISKLRRLLVEMKIARTIDTMLCAMDTLIRLYDKDCDLNSCVECVLRDTHAIGTCPVKIIGDCSIVE